MGMFVSKYISAMFGSQDVRLCMVGLDAAGKTTILMKLHMGETVHTIPTIGFNVEKVKFKNLTMTIWDVGGQGRLRPLWSYYYTNLDAIIFVVDSNDRERLKEAQDELRIVLSDEQLAGLPVIVFANKQDLPRAASVTEITSLLNIKSMAGNREWFVQGCCATAGEGLVQGLEWLSETLKRRKK